MPVRNCLRHYNMLQTDTAHTPFIYKMNFIHKWIVSKFFFMNMYIFQQRSLLWSIPFCQWWACRVIISEILLQYFTADTWLQILFSSPSPTCIHTLSRASIKTQRKLKHRHNECVHKTWIFTMLYTAQTKCSQIRFLACLYKHVVFLRNASALRTFTLIHVRISTHYIN